MTKNKPFTTNNEWSRINQIEQANERRRANREARINAVIVLAFIAGIITLIILKVWGIL